MLPKLFEYVWATMKLSFQLKDFNVRNGLVWFSGSFLEGGGFMAKQADIEETNAVAKDVANDNKSRETNGNRAAQVSEKPGGAERGGPDLDKAKEQQPPDAQIARK
jgi:hypothetical protein